jgi:type I restriction enzyme S subunit
MTGWPREPLRALGTWYGGGTPSKSRPEFWRNGSIPWLSPKDMGPDVLSGTIDHITEAAVAASSTRLIPAGSVAVVARSGILERTLPVAVVPFATTVNQDIKALSCRPDVDPRWAAWGLRASEQELLQTARKAGTTVASLEWRRFLDWRLPVPPIKEQQRIIEILEDHLSRLDAADDYLDAASRRLDRLRLARRRSVFASLGRAWGECPLLEVVSIENGQTPRGLDGALLDHPTSETVPFYKVGDMNSASGREMADARFHVRQGDARRLGVRVREAGLVLIPKRGGAIRTNKKRLLRTPAAFDLNTMGLRPGPRVLSEYLWHWIEGVDLGQIADGSNVPQINAPQMRSLALPVPPPEVQESVCADLDVLIERQTTLAEECARARVRAAQLRRALLTVAFSGGLTSNPLDLERQQDVTPA